VSDGFEPIRSYQRIFRPERRIYQIEGRALPVPGGVPLRWLAYATGTLLAVLVLGARSESVVLAIGLGAGAAGFAVGGREGAAVAAVVGLLATWIGGFAIGLLDWPLRLIVLPAALATLGTQATPDGRRADRFAISWLALRLAPMRRSLGRSLPPAGAPQQSGGQLWIEPDERGARLRRARVHGPALIFFSTPVVVRNAWRRRRIAQPPGRDGSDTIERLALADGESVEVRP
jgi:hypothetical protein